MVHEGVGFRCVCILFPIAQMNSSPKCIYLPKYHTLFEGILACRPFGNPTLLILRECLRALANTTLPLDHFFYIASFLLPRAASTDTFLLMWLTTMDVSPSSLLITTFLPRLGPATQTRLVASWSLSLRTAKLASPKAPNFSLQGLLYHCNE